MLFRSVEEWIQFGLYPDGAFAEFQRNSATATNRGHNYGANMLDTFISIADALRRDGDSSLYEYSSTNGIWESGCTTEPAKNLRLAVDSFLEIVSYEKDWYVGETSVNSDYRIDNIRAESPTKQHINEIYFAPLANKYYQDATIQAH